MKHHDRLLKFYLDLYNKTQVYRIQGMFSTGCRYAVEFDSEEEFKWHVIASIREQIFLSLAIPEYDSILMGNFDLVHILYTKKDKPQDFKKIESIARAHDLFILD